MPNTMNSHPKVPEFVEQIIGPDVLGYNVTYVCKERQSDSPITGHQDFRCRGLDSDDQAPMWLTQSIANRTRG